MKEARECLNQITEASSYGGVTDNEILAIIAKHMKAREAELMGLLKLARIKLEILFAHSDNFYSGGPEYGNLIITIDKTIAEYEEAIR